jgi:hypothetical protein
MPKLPIPDDWTTEQWRCIQIQWPDSSQWLAVLIGFLSHASRGRFWDKSTGSVADVQAIGRDIFFRNYPFNLCSIVDIPGDPSNDDPVDIPSGVAGGCFDELSEVLMSLCGYNPKAFKIEDGELWVKDFCGEWVSIGEITTTGTEPPVNLWDDVDPPPDFYACGKVTSIIDEFAVFSDAVWAYYQNPITFAGLVKAAVNPAVNLHTAHLYQWMAQLYLLGAISNADHWTNADIIAEAKCLALSSLAATGEGTDSEVEAVVSALATAFSNKWGNIPDIYPYSYWDLVRDTYGSKDCRLLLSLGATDGDAVCSCPGDTGAPTEPTAAGWYLSGEMGVSGVAPGGFNDAQASMLITVPHDVYGVIWHVTHVGGDPIIRTKRSNTEYPPTGFDVWMHGINSDDFGSSEDWQCQMGDSAFAEIDGELPETMVQRKAFVWSDTVVSPSVLKGQKALSTINVRAQGDPASANFEMTWRWLYNANSPSHS